MNPNNILTIILYIFSCLLTLDLKRKRERVGGREFCFVKIHHDCRPSLKDNVFFFFSKKERNILTPIAERILIFYPAHRKLDKYIEKRKRREKRRVNSFLRCC